MIAFALPAHAGAAGPPPATDEATTASGPRMENITGTEDELLLVGGGLVRGHITELTPGEIVVILPTGRKEVREIAWSELEVIRRATPDAGTEVADSEVTGEAGEEAASVDEAVDEMPPQPVPAPGEPEPESPYIGPRIRIDVPNGRDVALSEIVAEATGRVAFSTYRVHATVHEVVCWSPCNRRVDVNRGATHIITGEGVATSKPFHLPPGDAIKLHVRARPRFLRPAGSVITGLGGFAVLAGGIVLGAANRTPSVPDEMMTTPEDEMMSGVEAEVAEFDRKLRTAGGTVLGLGLGMVVGGIVMIVLGRTRVSFD